MLPYSVNCEAMTNEIGYKDYNDFDIYISCKKISNLQTCLMCYYLKKRCHLYENIINIFI